MSEDPTKIDIQSNVKAHLDPTVQRMSGIAIHGNTPFDCPYISQISGNLWQGGSDNQLILPHFFKHWITLAPWYQYKVKHELESFMSVKMYDSLDQATDQVDAIARWVNVCRESGPTLLTCQAGLNRSSLVAARALMLGPEKLKGWKAIKTLREKRSPAVLCNPYFDRYIKDFDKDNHDTLPKPTICNLPHCRCRWGSSRDCTNHHYEDCRTGPYAEGLE